MNIKSGNRFILENKQAEIAFSCGDTNLYVEFTFDNADSKSFRIKRYKRHGQWTSTNNPFYKALTELKRILRKKGYQIKDERIFYKLAIL